MRTRWKAARRPASRQVGLGARRPWLVLVWLLAGTSVVLGCGLKGPVPSPASAVGAEPDPRTMRFEPVEFHAPEPERLTLDNGMVVYLLEEHELPLVTITARIQAGGWLDPVDKVGLAGIAGTTMRTGGTARMSAEEVDEELDRLAAHVSVGMGVESGSATLDVLKKDLDRGLRIFADILLTPAFDPARVELAKLQTIEGIRRRQDQPGVIAGMEFAKMMYGADHPYARESTVESVSRLTREDLVRFHARTLHPNGIILGVTGDFERDRILDALRDVFGDWKPGDVPSITWAPAGGDPGTNGQTGMASKKTVRLIGKVTSQTHLRVGHPSIKETHPDYPALSVLNDILGGSSFRSRLFRTVRTQEGLAYSVGSYLRTGVRERGVWAMSAQTKLASTRDVVQLMIENMKRLREEAVTEEELEAAKEAFVNSFVFSFAHASGIVSRLISLEYDGLPKNYLEQLRDKVVKLTKEDLLEAARRHLHPDRLMVLAVGPPKTLVDLLASFGEVEEVEVEPER